MTPLFVVESLAIKHTDGVEVENLLRLQDIEVLVLERSETIGYRDIYVASVNDGTLTSICGTGNETIIDP